MTSSSFSFAEPDRLVQVDSAGPACTEGCITCGDIAVEVEIVQLLPNQMAVVATEAGSEEVSVALVSAVVGDTILVHAGEAITVIRR